MVILKPEKFPSNLYGFRSSVLGISADRILTIAVFSLIAFIVSRYYLILSLIILASGIILALLSKHGRQPVLYYISALVWKVSGKRITIAARFEVSEGTFTVISEGGKKAVILSIIADEIYDMNDQDSISVTQQIDNLIRSDLEIKISVVSVTGKILNVDQYENDSGEYQYYSMVNDAIRSTMFHRVYLILSNPGALSSKAPADEKIISVVGFLQSAGCTVRKNISLQEVSDLFYNLA